MNYVLVNRLKALEVGFSDALHRTTRDGCMVLTEREIINSPLLGGDLLQRLDAIDGKVVAKKEIIM